MSQFKKKKNVSLPPFLPFFLLLISFSPEFLTHRFLFVCIILPPHHPSVKKIRAKILDVLSAIVQPCKDWVSGLEFPLWHPLNDLCLSLSPPPSIFGVLSLPQVLPSLSTDPGHYNPFLPHLFPSPLNWKHFQGFSAYLQEQNCILRPMLC